MNDSLAGARRSTQPKAKAKDLFNLVMEGDCSITCIRKLIAVPPPIEAALRAYVRRYPEDGSRVERILKFRKDVSREFETLVEPQTLVFELSGARARADRQNRRNAE